MRDILRAGWLIERARADVYRIWQQRDPRFAASAQRTTERAAVIAAGLDSSGGPPDEEFSAGHRDWMLGIVGAVPGAVALSELLLIRFGDWVENHAGAYLGSSLARLKEIGDQEKAAVAWPAELPPAPPFEPVGSPAPAPPGDVLFRFAVLGDLHVGSPRGEIHSRAAVRDINSSGAELVVQMGDLADNGERTELERAKNVLDGLDVPYHVTIGNHDLFSASRRDLSGAASFADIFGRSLDGELFEHRGFKFAILDSAEHAVSPFPPFNLITGEFTDGGGGAVPRGALSPAQHDILAEVAGPSGGPAFLFLHHPPQPFTGFPPLVFGLKEADSGRLHAACDSGNVWGIFAGHTHRNKLSRPFGPTPVQEVAVPRDYPFGYALVDVTRHGYAFTFRQIGDQDLLHDAYAHTSSVHRRYSGGSDCDRGWLFTAAGL